MFTSEDIFGGKGGQWVSVSLLCPQFLMLSLVPPLMMIMSVIKLLLPQDRNSLLVLPVGSPHYRKMRVAKYK